MTAAFSEAGGGRARKHWGWGYADLQPDRAGLEAIAAALGERLGLGDGRIEQPVGLEHVLATVPRTRLRPPNSLADLFSDDPAERATRSLGKAYRDVVRGFRGRFDHVSDLVALPGSEQELAEILEWCGDSGVAAIPYGGGTSVVGGVEPRLGRGYRGAVTIDMARFNRLWDLDLRSRSARLGAGIRGPDLEAQLRPHGLTLRHFPQSFEYSTLGGWIATRAGGHFATLRTHIDDLVESVRAITPIGEWESRRLPGSGAGPSPDRMLIGSEGILGVITEAWVRVRPRPTHKVSCGVQFDDFSAGAEAVRALAQSDLNPANCRLLDPLEAATSGAGSGRTALLVLGFESAFAPVEEPMRLALECVREHGGRPGDQVGTGERGAEAATARGEDVVDSWRSAFLGAPYLRDGLVACGVLSETFETAITWDRFAEFHGRVIEAARRAVAEVCGGPAEGPGSPRISARFTHVYPDGPAPYYTILAPARRGGEIEQWDEIKAAVSEAVIAGGGTITHHHAVGRDHRPWYDRQRPEPFAVALGAAKRAVDPAAILNPGVLIAP